MNKKKVGKTMVKELASGTADIGVSMFISNLANMTIPFVPGGKFAFIPVAIGAAITGGVLGDLTAKKISDDIDAVFDCVEAYQPVDNVRDCVM